MSQVYGKPIIVDLIKFTMYYEVLQKCNCSINELYMHHKYERSNQPQSCPDDESEES